MFQGNEVAQQVDKHPLLWVAGGLGAGVLLGAVSETSSNDSKAGLHGAAGSGLLGGILGAVEAAAGDEVRRFVGETLGRREPQPEAKSPRVFG
jgi:hypothetical protein